MPKAIWGFNGTERPGAVYLAAALAGHSQLGLPAFSIYGTEVQEADDTNIPEDVKKNYCVLLVLGLLLQVFEENPIYLLGQFPWELQVLL